MNSVITGEIGEQVKDKETGRGLLDYDFKAVDPEGVEKKLRYVFDTVLTDEFVVPPGNSDVVDELLEKNDSTLRQTAQVPHAISGILLGFDRPPVICSASRCFATTSKSRPMSPW